MTLKVIIKTLLIFLLFIQLSAKANDIASMSNISEAAGSSAQAAAEQLAADASKVAGCVVQEGKVISKAFVKIFRDENILHECEIQSLRREKNQFKEVLSGLECGIVLSKFNDVIQNDRLEFYTREKDEKKP